MVRLKGKLHALLQRRGPYNHETGESETWANSYQPTASGGVEPNEEVDYGVILREAGQEIGFVATLRIAISIANGNNLQLIATSKTADHRHIITYAIEMPVEIIPEIALNPSTGGIRPITKEDLDKLKVLEPKDKEGVTCNNTEIFMFEHNVMAVKSAFVFFGETPQ